MSKKSFELARDVKGLRATVGNMVSQLYRRLDGLARGRKRAETRLRQAEAELDILRRKTRQLEDTVAGLPDENITRRLTAVEEGRRAGGAGVTDHGALTGLVPDDDHTQYQKESEKGATSGYASLDGSTLVPVAEMATGTPDGTKFLRDDRTWQTAGGAGAPGGNDDEVQYKNGSSFSGAALTEIEAGGNLRQVGVSADPSAPTSAIVSYADDRATFYAPRFRAPTGDPSWLQPSLWNKQIITLNLQGSTGCAMFGAVVYNFGAHTYGPTMDNSDKLGSMRRMLVGPTSAAAALTSTFINSFWRGDAAGLGGFFYAFRGGVADLAASNSRFMMGLHPYPDTTNNDISAKTNLLCFGKDAADTTWQFMHNDGSDTATKVNTTETVTADLVIEAFIYCPPNGSTVYWEFRDVETPSTQTGSVTTDLPASTQFLAPFVWGATATSGTSRLAVSSMYCESDY